MKKVAISRKGILLLLVACVGGALAWVASRPSQEAAKPPAPALRPPGAPPFNPDPQSRYPLARPLADPQRCLSRNDVTRPPTVTGEAAKDQAKVQALLAAHQGAIKEAREKLPFMDIAMQSLPGTYPRPVSEWRANEKTIYQALLAKGRFDVLVVPFQVQLYAVDRATRSLMTATLASALSAAQGVRIPDPYLVARALGDGERCVAWNDIALLAGSLGVKRVIYGFVGHERNNEMRVTIQVEDSAGAQSAPATQNPLTARHFEKLRISDETPPVDAFAAALPEILKFIGVNAPAAAAQIENAPADYVLPRSPLQLTTETANPARDAQSLQVLAALTPRYGDRTRERLIEKSLLALQSLSTTAPEYPLLRARALMHLGLRPAAIAALGAPRTAEEKHLLAMLNGNLPDAETHAKEIRNGARALVAWLEVNQMRAEYRSLTRARSIELATSLKLPGDAWTFLAVRAMTDWDAWSQFENIAFKALLDAELPVEGFTAEAIVRGAASIGDLARARSEADLSVVNHARKLLETSRDWCCAAVAGRPTALDYLDLIESIATDNLVRQAKFLTAMQGRPEQALEHLQRIERVYKNHPQMTFARAHAEARIARNADGASREGLARSIYAGAVNAMYWEQGQTPTAADAYHVRGGRQDYGHLGSFYASDYPFRSYYPQWESGDSTGTEAKLRAVLNHSTYDIAAVRGLVRQLGELEQKWDQVDALFISLGSRFTGHPELARMQAKESLRKGDLNAAERGYREALRIQPDAWEVHNELGTLLFEHVQTARSAELFTGYPGFKKGSTEHRVAVANRAYAAGSLFYWSGNFAQALPFYRIAADLDTGSDSSLSSALRIALVGGDFAAAMATSLDRARRYNSAYAYRDYIAMLHATGRSSEGWDAFNSLAGRIAHPQIWESALVGHRIERKDEAAIAAWAGQEGYRKSGDLFANAAMYALRAGVTDRAGTDDLASRIAALDWPVWMMRTQPPRVERETGDGRLHVVGPSAPLSATLPPEVFADGLKTQIKSDLVRFAEAYRAIRKGEYAAAHLILKEAVSLFDPANVNVGYLLPYFAYAAAKAGDVSAVQPILARFSPREQRFDYHLASATLQASAGKSGEALQSLRLAQHRRPFTESRPLMTEYQLAEISEWIYEMTRDAKIKEFVLNWARANQTFQPWHAWAYALEARLSPAGPARTRAIAIAQYLDRNSERLASIPKREVDAAVREFAGKNPFVKPERAVKREAA